MELEGDQLVCESLFEPHVVCAQLLQEFGDGGDEQFSFFLHQQHE